MMALSVLRGSYLHSLVAPFPLKMAALVVSCVLSGYVCAAETSNTDEALNFDVETLRARGIDVSVATYFSHKARFTPGMRTVSVLLNGRDIGNISVLFDKAGQPCVSRDFLNAAGLKMPQQAKDVLSSSIMGDGGSDFADVAKDERGESEVVSCIDYADAFPGTVFSLFPTEERIEVLTPPEALISQTEKQDNFSTGGVAALLNYSLFTSQNQFDGGGSSDYKQGAFEAGVNANDWLLRSKQMVSQSNGKVNRDSLYTYAQHTLRDAQKIAQIGQINVSDTLFSGYAINGAQLIPETALEGDGGSGISVSGIAQTAQARVDIRQSGVLIYSTLVPAGPFTLTDIPVISVNTDLDVTVTESSGATNAFTVSAASLVGAKLGRPLALSMALGTLRDIDTPFDTPWLATASNGWQATNYLNLVGGVMVANKYQSLAGGVDFMPQDNLRLSANLLGSHEQLNDNSGVRFSASASYTAPSNVYVATSWEQNSEGYRDLLDTFSEDALSSRTKNSYSLSAGWSNDLLGSLSLGYSNSTGYGDNDNTSKRLIASWGRKFKSVSVNANWQREIDADSGNGNGYGRNSGDTFYLNVSIPFGSQSVNTFVRGDNGNTTYGAQTSGNITQDLSYNVSAETSGNNDRVVNGGLNANLHYTRLGVNAGSSGKHSRYTSATLDGGIVAHSEGVTFSPYAVQDTFGVVSLGQDVAGVEISTPQGTVWTDKWGNAVVPSLNAYQNSNVMINTDSLPKNVDVNNGMKTVNAGRGAVHQLQFGVLSVRRAMLRLTMPDGKLVPKGAVIFDDDNQYVTTAVEDGVVFIADVENSEYLYALADEAGRKCQLKFKLRDMPSLDEYYENVDATCEM
ncbi:fimbrial biogenesis usher protein [Aeromonas veronii]|uniref:fimbrial biogenesis usher protein n=1 Tax=Aeromonas veronii TaxID=654 RepID=UPI003BA0DADD